MPWAKASAAIAFSDLPDELYRVYVKALLFRWPEGGAAEPSAATLAGEFTGERQTRAKLDRLEEMGLLRLVRRFGRPAEIQFPFEDLPAQGTPAAHRRGKSPVKRRNPGGPSPDHPGGPSPTTQREDEAGSFGDDLDKLQAEVRHRAPLIPEAEDRPEFWGHGGADFIEARPEPDYLNWLSSRGMTEAEHKAMVAAPEPDHGMTRDEYWHGNGYPPKDSKGRS